MKKTIASILLICLFAFSLTACDSIIPSFNDYDYYDDDDDDDNDDDDDDDDDDGDDDDDDDGDDNNDEIVTKPETEDKDNYETDTPENNNPAVSAQDFSLLDISADMISSGVYIIDDEQNEFVFSLFNEPSGTPMISFLMFCPDSSGDAICGTYTFETETDEYGLTWTSFSISDVFTEKSYELTFVESENGKVYLYISEEEFYEGQYLSEDETVAYMRAAIGLISDKAPHVGLSMNIDNNGKLHVIRNDTDSSPMGAEGTWTIFVYLCGTDLESDNGFATYDLAEMIYASTGSNVRFIVQTGGASTWQNEVMKSNKLCRYEICNGEIYAIEEQPNASMGSADTLSDFLKWGVEKYPAAKMGVVFWNHGGGSISGVCFDEMNDFDSLSLTEINSALAEVSASMTDKFEFVGFDACLMGTVETANILATYSRYMYGSEETEPGYGWDYCAIGNFLGENPGADGAELGKIVCDSFFEGCEEINQDSIATLSVIDLSKIDNLIISFNDYAKNLYEASENNNILSSVVRNAKSADNYGGNNKSEGYTNMVDLAGIVLAGADYADGAEEVLSAIEDAVVYKRNGYAHSDACGLSSYYPLELQGSAELKIFGDISISPYYLSFVDRIVYGNQNNGYTGDYSNDTILDYWGDIGNTDNLDSYWDDYGDFEPTGESPLIVFYDEPQLLSDGTYGFSLTDESLEYTASVQANVYMLSEDMEDIIELGMSVDIIPDWENGIFLDNFDGYWFSLPDGQILAVYVVDECYGYDVYTSPVLLNGQKTNLRITHNYMTGEITIDGAWDGIDENNMAGKNVYELSAGDSIVPLYYAFAIDSDDEYYYYGNEYVFDGEPEIYFDLLYDGEYLYGYTIYDIFGDYYITEFVNFTVDGEYIYYDDLS